MRALLCLSAFIFPSFAAAIPLGVFQQPVTITVAGYQSASECAADKGFWEEGFCRFQAHNEVSIGNNGGYFLKVSTIGTNLHSCDYEGAAIASGNGLISQLESEEWDDRSSSFVKALCELRATFPDANTVSVNNNGKCSSFCGMRARLVVEEAKRVR